MNDRKNELPKREEIKEEFKWNLEAIYENDELFEEDLKRIKKLADELKSYSGKLGISADNLYQCLKLQDNLSEVLGKAFVYARMRKDENNANSKYQALADRISTLSVYVGSATSFLVPEILTISENKIDEFISFKKELELYKQFFNEIFRMKPHILSQDQEELLAQAGELAQAPEYIYGMLNNADIKFPYIKDENGEEIEITKGRYTTLLESKDRRVRKDVFEGLYNTYGKYINTFAATLNSNVKKNIFYSKVRNYNSALESSLHDDNVSTNVYDQLISTVHENIDLLHRYISIRKKILKLNELHMYDIYVPMINNIDIKIKYEEAKIKVIEGLKPLGDEYRGLLEKAFSSRWIDVYENEGKTSGAYSWGSYATNPYILLNYQENVNDMFTLVHELGHSMHSYYSNNNQPIIYAQYKIFVAEVASTVNESLLMHHLLNTTQDKNTKLYYLNHYLEQFRGTIYRQVMFAEFERAIHEKVDQGEALTPELLNEMYYNLNKFYYGNEIIIDDLIKYEWARIPHMYMDFYVYKYATGYSAAISLSKQIIEEGETAVSRYIEFLKSGGSDYPINLLKKAGVDMNSKEPIQNALDVFKDILSQMEELIVS